jgi:hypothetical protein
MRFVDYKQRNLLYRITVQCDLSITNNATCCIALLGQISVLTIIPFLDSFKTLLQDSHARKVEARQVGIISLPHIDTLPNRVTTKYFP